jgi:hypothetical protein
MADATRFQKQNIRSGEALLYRRSVESFGRVDILSLLRILCEAIVRESSHASASGFVDRLSAEYSQREDLVPRVDCFIYPLYPHLIVDFKQLSYRKK